MKAFFGYVSLCLEEAGRGIWFHRRVVAPALVKSVAQKEAAKGTTSGCRIPRDLEVLAALPKGRVFNEIDLGPAILVHTHHSVVSGPYHRATQGIQDAIVGFMAQPHNFRDAPAIAESDYIAICADGAQARLSRSNPAGLAQRLVNGMIPDWLDRLPGEPGSRLLVFRIRKTEMQLGSATGTRLFGPTDLRE